MNQLIHAANEYIKESDWKTIALLKVCLCAMGIMIGLKIPKRKMRLAGCTAFAVFAVTYVPLMLKLVAGMKSRDVDD